MSLLAMIDNLPLGMYCVQRSSFSLLITHNVVNFVSFFFFLFFFAESSNISVELPPELCNIIMSPISISCLYTFSFVPSIMYHLEAVLIAVNLKNMLMDQCTQNVIIPTIKVLY